MESSSFEAWQGFPLDEQAGGCGWNKEAKKLALTCKTLGTKKGVNFGV